MGNWTIDITNRTDPISEYTAVGLTFFRNNQLCISYLTISLKHVVSDDIC